MAVHEIIKKLREDFTKQTTLPHSRPGEGHTQYYAEHVEIMYMEQQKEIEQIKGEQWISVDKDLPPSQKRVFCHYKNENNKSRIVKAMYLPPFTVQAQDFYEDWEDVENDYSEAEDTYYVKSGWFEVVDNWEYASCLINAMVTHWQPLPKAPEVKE